MINRANVIFFILILTLSFGCEQRNFTKDNAELLMNEYFEKVSQNNFALVKSYYSEEFYQNMSIKKWEEEYNRIHSILGKLISVKLISWEIKTKLTTSGFGRDIKFVYSNKYDNEHITEWINIFIPSGK